MSNVARIDDPIFLGRQAKAWAREMVAAEWRGGPDDKLDAVAHRLQVRYGVEASIIKQCWSRPPRQMLVSRWMSLFSAYLRWTARAEKRAQESYEETRTQAADLCHPALVRLADLVAGHRREPEAAEDEAEVVPRD